TTEQRNEKLLAELAALGEGVDRSAAFYCALAVAKAGSVVWTVETHLQGYIATSPRGEFGFGYDPVFIVPDRGTLAEMSLTEKNQISARGQALHKLRAFLQSQ